MSSTTDAMRRYMQKLEGSLPEEIPELLNGLDDMLKYHSNECKTMGIDKEKIHFLRTLKTQLETAIVDIRTRYIKELRKANAPFYDKLMEKEREDEISKLERRLAEII